MVISLGIDPTLVSDDDLGLAFLYPGLAMISAAVEAISKFWVDSTLMSPRFCLASPTLGPAIDRLSVLEEGLRCPFVALFARSLPP